MSMQGRYQDGHTPTVRAVMLQRDVHTLVFTDGVQTHRYPVREIAFQPGQADLPDRLQLPDGGIIEVAQTAHCQQLCNSLPLTAIIVAWLHRTGRTAQQHVWQLSALLLPLLAMALFCAYHLGVPWLMDEALQRSTPALEQQLAEHAIGLLEETTTLRPTRLSPQRQDSLQAMLQQAVPVGSRYHYRLQLVDTSGIGPRVLALPAGLLVMSDQQVRLAHGDAELFGLLAQAVGHVEARHGLRLLIQEGGPLMVASLLRHDGNPALSMATLLLPGMDYPPDMEEEARQFALHALAARGSRACVLVSVQGRLDRAEQQDHGQMIRPEHTPPCQA